MSKEKNEKKSLHGGARIGAGRPKGRSKTKICVSISAAVWQVALSSWNGKASRLIENLLSDYVHNASTNPMTSTP